MQIQRSMKAVEAAQERLMTLLNGVQGLSGVGIGLNSRRDDYVLRVLFESGRDESAYPSEVDGVAVEYSTVGAIKAQ